MATPIFDYAGSLRRMGNDPALFQEMVVLLREDAPKYFAEIDRSVAAGDFPSLKRAVHTLKGLVLNFGATRATTAALALELIAASAAGEPAEMLNLPAAIEEMEASMKELLKALERPAAVKQHQSTAVHKH